MWRRRPVVLVVGAFRSGTNATKACLERFFKVDVVFNRWFWKHGLAPSFSGHPLPADVTVLLLCRHPEAWAPSIHRFWRERRPELAAPESLSHFLREPFIVYDTTGSQRRPHHWFSGPIDYWARYHYSWLHWADVSAQMRVLRCEDLMRDADACLSPVAEAAGWRRREAGPLKLPAERVGPAVSPARAGEASSLLDEDRAFIRRQLDPDVMSRLGYAAGLGTGFPES